MAGRDKYEAALAWLYERQPLGIQLGLERMEVLVAALGRPQLAYRSVHVAGTNGKGSVATFMAAALHRSGHRTGFYTSPHLVEFTERFRIDGEQMSRDQLVPLVDELRDVTTELEETGDAPTFFELCTAVALLHFRNEQVDWAVVETGMGGARDATNVVEPALTVITNVSDDHAAFLGPDIAAIAAEKAGIVKPGVPLVTGAKGEALAVLRKRCEDLGSPIVVVGEDYLVESNGEGLRLVYGAAGTRYEVRAAGRHQLDNAALAIAGCDVLRESGVDLPAEAVRRALAETALPGRLETLTRDGVDVVLDGAHNLAAAQSLGRWLDDRGVEYHLIVGFSSDKDWPSMLEQWLSGARSVHAVRTRSPRSLDPAVVGSVVPDGLPFAAVDGFGAAWRRVQVSGGPRTIVVAGSLFLVGEARAFLIGQDLREVGGSQ
jgi:dihydrofolate synthase/folylpolyglutamate synthase